MTKYSFMMRSIPNNQQSIEQKHADFFKRLKSLDASWSLSNKSVPELGKPGEFLTSVVLNNYFGASTKGRINYQTRTRVFRDEGMYDDHLVLDFDPAKINFHNLVAEAFQKFVRAFDAYYAYVGPTKLVESDFEKRRRTDYRKGVVRIFPANYISTALCNGSFGFAPSQVEKRCKNHAASLKLEKDGIFIIAAFEALSPEEADAIDKDFRELLGWPR